MSIIAAVIVLGVLIIVHELGHFLAAKAAGIGVERFSVGFGRKVWGKTVGETEYRISAIPIGGYVKMVGENPGEEEDAARKSPEKAFTSKPVWQRLMVIVAGPVFNLLLAVLIFTAVFITGVPIPLAVVGELQEGYPASEAGLRPGDRITAIDGHAVSDWEDMTDLIHGSPGMELHIAVERGAEVLQFEVTPRRTVVKNIFGEDTAVGLIGISPSPKDVVTRRYGPLASAGLGFTRTWDIIKLTFVAVAKIIQRVVPADTIGGPLMIVQLAGEQAKMGLENLISLIAFLSINLGIFNLLPVPILDGGHVLFLLIEAARGKPVSIRRREMVQQIGLVLLLLLFIFAFYNDIMRLMPKILEGLKKLRVILSSN